MKRKRAETAQHGTGLRQIMHAAPHSFLGLLYVGGLSRILKYWSQNDDLRTRAGVKMIIEVGTR